jgi:hypothetical protein
MAAITAPLMMSKVVRSQPSAGQNRCQFANTEAIQWCCAERAIEKPQKEPNV